MIKGVLNLELYREDLNMESEGNRVLSDKSEGSGNSSEVDIEENDLHEKKSDVRYFFLSFWDDICH